MRRIKFERAARLPKLLMILNQEKHGAIARWDINDEQREVLRAIVENERVIVLKGRQMGVSTITLLAVLAFAVANPGVPCTSCPTPCQQCRQGGNGPYCSTTPCACACHAKGKKKPIEPTEEQRSDAAAFYHNSIQSLPLDVCDWVETGAGCANVDADVVSLARLLAEREAKLREELRGEWARLVEAREVTAMIVEGHQLRARVAELESEVRIAWADCADGSCEACAKCVDQAKHQRDFATARVAELERMLSTLSHGYHQAEDDFLADIKEMKAREAQHLADIKAGRKAVAAWLDDPWLEGRRKLGEDFMAATAHYDDAKAAEGGEG